MLVENMSSNHDFCVYCGKQTNLRQSREHIIPKALNSDYATYIACKECNNGPLSRLDEALSRESPLKIPSLLVGGGASLSEELFLNYNHDVSDNHFVAKYELNSRGKICIQPVPQIMFSDEGPVICDPQRTRDTDSYLRALKNIFEGKDISSVFRGNKHLKYQREVAFEQSKCNPILVMQRPANTKHYTLFLGQNPGEEVKRRIVEQAHRMLAGEINYLSLASMEAFPFVGAKWHHPTIIRALMKIGINCLALLSKDNKFIHDHFQTAINWILNKRELPACKVNKYQSKDGFLSVEAFFHRPIESESHHVWLSHDPTPFLDKIGEMEGGVWQVDFSFFGGMALASVSFPGKPLYQSNFQLCFRTGEERSSRPLCCYPPQMPTWLLYNRVVSWDVSEILPFLGLTNYRHQFVSF